MNTNATAAVVDAKMEPITRAVSAPQTILTGQYLFDTFMGSNDADLTRMAVIKSWADSEAYTPDIVKGAADGMVKRAKELDIAAGIPEKVTKDGKEVANRGPKQASAMNVRTIIQTVFGGLKFARAEMESLKFDDKTGYFAANAIAKKALESKRIVWTGEAVRTQADKDRARLAREQKDAMDARIKAMQQLPQMPGESDSDWMARVVTASKGAVEAARDDAEQKIIAAVVESLETKHGIDRLIAIATAICERHGVSIEVKSEQQSDTNEPDEQATLDAMANVPEEQAHA